MSLPFIGPEQVADRLTWAKVVDALEAGHRLPRARIGDTLLERGGDALLSRSAWIDGLGLGVKSATVMSGNAAKGLPTVQAAMLVFSEETATPEAVLDGSMVTDWKTTGDSLLGAKLLARADSRSLTVIGAGRVAETLARGYAEMFPGLVEIRIFNRTPERAERLAALLEADGLPARSTPDLAVAVSSADIVTAATMSRDPVVKGAWVRPGTHVDLVGGFTPEMREGDDDLVLKAELFVDCRETVLDHVGDIAIPLAAGRIDRNRTIPDLYDLVAGQGGRRAPREITLFKNGGGAHLDLMTARAILASLESGA